MKRTTFAITDIGMKRKNNQDAFLKDDNLGLYIVADGMGGHRGGEVASQVAVDFTQQFCKKNMNLNGRDIIDKAVNFACAEINRQSREHEDLAGMGTTLVVLLFHDDVLYIGQVGDSRAYLIAENGIWQLTEDHSLVNEEIRAGRIDAADAHNYQFKNVITRSVGYEDRVNVDIYRRKVKKGDLYVSCTDGLSGFVTISEIKETMEKNGVEQGIRNLVTLANSRGGDDNITALACLCE